MALDITDHFAMARNTNAIIETIKNTNDWQRYARELEERISKLEVKLKETGDSAIRNWFMSLTRKAIIVAGDLWLQKYGEVPVHPDVIPTGKNQFENHIEKSDEAFLALVGNVLKLIVASESNSQQSNHLYAAYEQYAKTNVVNVLFAETRAEKWKIEKVLSERPFSPADRELAVVKRIDATDPYSIIGPMAMEML